MQNSTNLETSNYRTDIDGLRAVAVSCVVIYHLVHQIVPKGFLGVDIFFVISGYLITSIIWREAQERRFSFLRFYERRLRRLAPALLAVLVVTTVACILLLLPKDLMGYSKSVVAGLFFVANIYFWRDTGYFSSSAEEKPLLHLWSLSVEEQFYLFFPIIIIFLARFVRITVLFVWLLVLGSFALNVFMIHIGGENPAFYLLPTRAWELGAGALVAILASPKFSASATKILRSLAVVLIVFGLFYQGQWVSAIPVALPVVVGTALLIWLGAPKDTWTGQALALPPVNFIGKISYSLYLVHWPLIVLPEYYLVRDLAGFEAVLVALVSVALAAASWRYVEQPFRGKQMPVSRVGAWSGAGVLGLTLVAGAAVLSQGFPNRLPPEAAAINQSVGTHFRCAVSDLSRFGASRACDMTLQGTPTSEARVVLLGNSHAQMYAPLVKARLEREEDVTPAVLIPVNACLPTTTVNIRASCLQAARNNLAQVLGMERLEHVIIAFNWPLHRDLFLEDGREVQKEERAQELRAGIEDIRDQFPDDVRFSLIGPIATPGFDISSVLSRQIAFGHKNLAERNTSSEDFYEDYGPVFQGLDGNPRINFIRPDRVLCEGEACQFIMEGRSVFADGSHVAEPSLYLLEPAFGSLFE